MKNLLADSKLFFILLLSSCLIILFDLLGFLYFPKLLIQTVILPIQFGFYQVGKSLGGQINILIDSRFAALENKALKQQLAQVITENAILEKRLKEDDTLVAQTSKLDPQVFSLVPSRVIGFGRNLTIDKGIQDGVVLGQPVVYQSNYIGVIIKVSPKFSQVLLPYDPDSKVAAFSQNKIGRAKGILVGQFGSELLLDKILHQEPVEVGDLVYSEGSEGNLPRGLILGRVDQVLENQNEVFKQAKVKPVFDFNDLDIVFIMKGA